MILGYLTTNIDVAPVIDHLVHHHPVILDQILHILLLDPWLLTEGKMPLNFQPRRRQPEQRDIRIL